MTQHHAQIVIDDGSNFIKTAHQRGEERVNTLFPSRVIRSALTSPNGHSSGSYSCNGDYLSVTETAANTVPTNTRSYQTSDVNAVLINHAIDQIECDTCDIILTMPVSHFLMPDGSKNEEAIAEKIASAKREVLPLDGRTLPEIKRVFVMPEGVPAFVHAKKELDLPAGRYLIADIGGTTTDLIIFDANNQIEKFLSVPVGALNMLNTFGAMVISKMKLNEITDELALQGLINGKILGKSFAEDAKFCVESFQQQINDNIVKMGDLSLFDGVIYSGGGALLLSTDESVIKTQNPQFDNANGCLSLFGSGE